MPFQPITDVRDVRRKTGLNQTKFWNRIGVTQPGRSLYEAGREMPNAVRELVRLAYIEGLNLASLKQVDVTIASLLKEQQPELYRALKKEVNKKNQYSAD